MQTGVPQEWASRALGQQLSWLLAFTRRCRRDGEANLVFGGRSSSDSGSSAAQPVPPGLLNAFFMAGSSLESKAQPTSKSPPTKRWPRHQAVRVLPTKSPRSRLRVSVAVVVTVRPTKLRGSLKPAACDSTRSGQLARVGQRRGGGRGGIVNSQKGRRGEATAAAGCGGASIACTTTPCEHLVWPLAPHGIQ